MASTPDAEPPGPADPSLQVPLRIIDDEDPSPDTYDPFAGYPPLPDFSEGLVWSQFPPDSRFISDPQWYDSIGNDMIERRRIFSSRSKSEQVAAALTLLSDFPERGLQIVFAAAVKGKSHVIEALLDAGATPHPKPLAPGEIDGSNLGNGDDQSAVPLHAAAFNGHLPCVQLLMEKGGVDVNARCDLGGTPLMRASWGEHPEIVEWLLANGADPTLTQESGTNALEFAAGGGSIECARLLLEHGGQGEPVEHEVGHSHVAELKITPDALKAAANSGNVEMLQFLLEKDAYPMDHDDEVWKGERLDEEQRRILQSAICYANTIPCLRLILSYLSRQDHTGDFDFIDFPQDVKENIMDKLMVYLDEPDVFKLLWNVSLSSSGLTTLEYKGQALPKTQYINQLLHIGAETGSLDCVKFILSMPNVDINAPGHRKVGHLYRAAIDQQLDVVRYFLENENHKPDLQQANGLYANGATALFGAVMGGNAEIVRLILKYGGPLEAPISAALLSSEPKKVIVRAVQTYRSPVTIEPWKSTLPAEAGTRSVELDLDKTDVGWLSSLQIRKSDVELKRDDRGERDLKVQEQSRKTWKEFITSYVPLLG